jgi:GAF domain-containing protein
MRQEVLDRPALDALDGLAREAALEIGSVAALVSVLEGGRPYVRSEVGLPLSMVAGQETPLLDSLCLLVAGRRGPLIVEDAQRHSEARVSVALRRLGVRSCLGFPLLTDDRVIGSFCVIGDSQRCWERAEVEQARRLAELATVELTARLGSPDGDDVELEVLCEKITQAFLHSAGLEDSLADALEAICRDLAFDVAGAWIADAEGAELQRAGHWHRDSLDIEAFSEICGGLRFAAGEDMVGAVWARQELIWSPDLPLASDYPRAAVAAAAGLSCGLWVPLQTDLQPLGTLELLAAEARPVHAKTVPQMPQIGHQLAGLIALRRDEKALPSTWFGPAQDAASRGPFTGLPQPGEF